MQCPYCKLEGEVIPQVAYDNARMYETSPLIATLCCSKPMRVKASISFNVGKAITEELEDAWGTPFSQEDPMAYLEEHFGNYTIQEIDEEGITAIRTKLEELKAPHLYYEVIAFIVNKIQVNTNESAN